MKEMVPLLINLVKTPSETGREQTLSKMIFHRLETLAHFECQFMGLSQVYQTKRNPNKPTLGFFGHLDTVKNQQDKEPYIEGDRLYGCGASDMKGGLAVMIRLMESFKEGNCDYNLVFVYYDREEGAYLDNGLEPVMAKWADELRQIDLAFALEPTDNKVQMGCMGGIHVLVHFLGKSAHSARPWQGENALHKAWPVLKRLSELERQEVDFGGLKFYEVINATQASAMNPRNSIPGKFSLNINYRFAPGKSMEEAKEELRALIGEGPELDFVDQAPSAPVLDKNPMFDRFQALHHLEVESKQAWTDIARLAHYGISGINLGPGRTDQAHQKNEWISLTDLEKGLKLYKQFLFK